jgi:hypothetical protein
MQSLEAFSHETFQAKLALLQEKKYRCEVQSQYSRVIERLREREEQA